MLSPLWNRRTTLPWLLAAVLAGPSASGAFAASKVSAPVTAPVTAPAGGAGALAVFTMPASYSGLSALVQGLPSNLLNDVPVADLGPIANQLQAEGKNLAALGKTEAEQAAAINAAAEAARKGPGIAAYEAAIKTEIDRISALLPNTGAPDAKALQEIKSVKAMLREMQAHSHWSSNPQLVLQMEEFPKMLRQRELEAQEAWAPHVVTPAPVVTGGVTTPAAPSAAEKAVEAAAKKLDSASDNAARLLALAGVAMKTVEAEDAGDIGAALLGMKALVAEMNKAGADTAREDDTAETIKQVASESANGNVLKAAVLGLIDVPAGRQAARAAEVAEGTQQLAFMEQVRDALKQALPGGAPADKASLDAAQTLQETIDKMKAASAVPAPTTTAAQRRSAREFLALHKRSIALVVGMILLIGGYRIYQIVKEPNKIPVETPVTQPADPNGARRFAKPDMSPNTAKDLERSDEIERNMP